MQQIACKMQVQINANASANASANMDAFVTCKRMKIKRNANYTQMYMYIMCSGQRTMHTAHVHVFANNGITPRKVNS